MAAGAAPAPEVKVETKTETTEAVEAQPQTLAQRIGKVLHDIFAGRDEYAGWRQ
jgi:hypothetical protein